MNENAPIRIDPAAVTARERYHLLTSLIVPRPIAWVSTRSRDGVPNLGPFSYFAALSPSPMLVGISIGARDGEPKDSLVNIRETGAFCVNIVGESQLEAMNLSSGEYPPEIDEFELVGLPLAEAESVRAPYVATAPAVLECRLTKEVELDGAHHIPWSSAWSPGSGWMTRWSSRTGRCVSQPSRCAPSADSAAPRMTWLAKAAGSDRCRGRGP